MGVFEAYFMNNILCSLQISLSGSPEPLNEKIMGLDNLILRKLQSNGSYSLQMTVEDTCLPDILTQRTESKECECRAQVWECVGSDPRRERGQGRAHDPRGQRRAGQGQ